MEKLGFGALLKTAFKRCFERRLSHLVAIQLLLSFLALRLWRVEGAVAVVRVNGVEIERHTLDEDGVFPLNGGSNLLVIRDGEAAVVEADCPDLLCVRQGKIRYRGQTIICLPNRLSVTIEGGEESGLDAVVG